MENCEWCKVNKKGYRATKFCSLKCDVDFRNCERFMKWYADLNMKVSNKSLRIFLEIIHGYECSRCKIKNWNNKPITLEVEHKDGNSKNNHPNNVCLLCPNCHSLTPNFKTKNKGNGRHSLKNEI